VTENDILAAGGNPMSQSVKLALKGLAFNMAAELKPRGVAAIAITPGFLRSEALMRTGAEIQLEWLAAVSKRTKRFLKQLPNARVRKGTS